jgi:putative hydrolase of the HAD superfamily
VPKVSLALFDMDNVLCRYDRKRRIADLSRLSGKPADQIYAAIWASGFEDQADAGRLDTATYLAGFAERLGYPITLDEWLENRKCAITPMPEVLALMAQVKFRSKVAVLTSNHALVRDHLEMLFPELPALCGDEFYVSAQFGVAKPDPEVYLRCVAAAGGTPGATLFIDDSQTNVDGALAAGLHAQLFTGAPDLAITLKAYALI